MIESSPHAFNEMAFSVGHSSGNAALRPEKVTSDATGRSLEFPRFGGCPTPLHLRCCSAPTVPSSIWSSSDAR